MTNQPQEQEDWKRIEKELVYVATYASPERRDDLLRFLKGQFQTILVAEIERAKAEERDKIEVSLNEEIAPHGLSLEDSVWLKRVLNKVFNHNV